MVFDAGEHALRMVVRDMGNGVDRVESANLLPVAHAKILGRRSGVCMLAAPLSGRLRDLVLAGLMLVGVTIGDGGCARLRGYARPYGDQQTTITVWTDDAV